MSNPQSSMQNAGHDATPLPPGKPLIDDEGAAIPSATPAVVRASRALLGISLVLIALNLRPVFSSVSALLPEIMQATGLTPAGAGVLTTLPVLCMGVFAPLAPILAGRWGAERTLTAAMALLAAGTAARGLGIVPALLGGAVASGAAIAVMNVLLPGLVKRDFPDRLALMTGLFTMALSAGAAAAAGLTVPLRTALGGSWALALAAWAVPAVIALGIWLLPHGADAHKASRLGGRAGIVWRSGLAWQVTLFMGLQSALAYCTFGYLAPILRERGMAAASAGLVVSWSVAMQCVACLLAPVLATRGRDQRFVNVAFMVMTVLGFLGCVFAPLGGALPAATVLGLGQGGLIALAMTAIVLRSRDAAMAANLSSMAQSVGYTLASLGPLLLGLLRGATGSYASAALLFVVVGALAAVFGYGAGRARQIGD